MSLNLKYKCYLSLFIFSILFLVGCQKDSLNNQIDTRTSFHAYTNELFVTEVQSDTITLNYTLKSPKDYGITLNSPSLGTYNIDAFKESIIQSENHLSRLKNFPYSHLTTEQQLTYDILEYTFPKIYLLEIFSCIRRI